MPEATAGAMVRRSSSRSRSPSRDLGPIVSSDQEADAFTLEIVRDSLVAICDEMFATVRRTSQSTIIYEVLDLAVGLTDADGRLITQGNGVPFFLGVIDQAVREILAKYSPSGIADGDIFVTNDPYESGTHLSDVTVIAPIFAEGTLIGFAANKAHWIDVGGRDAGSVALDATEVFQEGLQLPYVRLFKGGTADQNVFDLIAANVRTPGNSIGDLMAQVASVRIAALRFAGLYDKYGHAGMSLAISRMIEHSRSLVALALQRLPPGVYTAEDWIDDDGRGLGPYRTHVSVTIGDGEVVCDFTGTSPQLPSAMNCSRSALISACRVVFKAITGPQTALSDGSFDGLRVVCPPRTVFTAERPAAVSTYYEVLCRVSDLIWKALAPALPESLTAGHFSSVAADLIVGTTPEEELFILFEPTAGGWGAGADKDGERGVFCISDGDTYAIPVEVAETKYGVRVQQYSLNVGQSGAGRCRGGEGVVRDYEIVADSATVTGIFTRNQVPPWGVEGGLDGSRNEIQVIRHDSGEITSHGTLSCYPLDRGDVVRISTATGGGWGHPLERPIHLVVSDVRNGFVTVEEAEQTYGVLVDRTTLEAKPAGARVVSGSQ
jgi:N-methylhydantoinase B